MRGICRFPGWASRVDQAGGHAFAKAWDYMTVRESGTAKDADMGKKGGLIQDLKL